MIFLELFLTFLKIGLFGFGGGYAMLSMIQGEVVTRYGWLTAGEFTDIVAVSQATPGPIGINSATYVGYTAVLHAGYSPSVAVFGSLTATVAVVLPSFVLMLALSRLLLRYRNHPLVHSLFLGIRPAVVGLLAAAALSLLTPDNFGTWNGEPRRLVLSVVLCLSAFIAVRRFRLSPVLVLLLCGLAGCLLYA